MVYAVERAVTVKAAGLEKFQLVSVAVFPEWVYDLYLQIGPGPRPVGRGLADPQILVTPARLSTGAADELGTGIHTKREGTAMYGKAIGAALPTTGLAAHFAGGLTYLYAGMIAFVVVGALFIEPGCCPRGTPADRAPGRQYPALARTRRR